LNKSINLHKIELLFEGAPEELAGFVEVMINQFLEYKIELVKALDDRKELAIRDLRHKIKSICLSFDVPVLINGMDELCVMLGKTQEPQIEEEEKLNHLLKTMDEVVFALKSLKTKE